MSKIDFHLHVAEASRQTDVAFGSVFFATLALSVQFSPGFGVMYAWTLVLSWICFGVAGVLVGLRLVFRDRFNNINIRINQSTEKANALRAILESPLSDKAFALKKVVNPDNGEIQTRDQVQSYMDGHLFEVNSLMGRLDTTNLKLKRFFNSMLGFYLMGMVLNLFFASANYLAKAYFS